MNQQLTRTVTNDEIRQAALTNWTRWYDWTFFFINSGRQLEVL